jgi:hypothetical protein
MGWCNVGGAEKQKSRTEPSAAWDVDVQALETGHESLCTRHHDRLRALAAPARAAVGRKKAGNSAGVLWMSAAAAAQIKPRW